MPFLNLPAMNLGFLTYKEIQYLPKTLSDVWLTKLSVVLYLVTNFVKTRSLKIKETFWMPFRWRNLSEPTVVEKSAFAFSFLSQKTRTSIIVPSNSMVRSTKSSAQKSWNCSSSRNPQFVRASSQLFGRWSLPIPLIQKVSNTTPLRMSCAISMKK